MLWCVNYVFLQLRAKADDFENMVFVFGEVHNFSPERYSYQVNFGVSLFDLPPIYMYQKRDGPTFCGSRANLHTFIKTPGAARRKKTDHLYFT